MALFRFLKRRISCVALFLLATTFWVFYLIISAPAASDTKYNNGAMPYHQSKDPHLKESVTRQIIAAAPLEPANQHLDGDTADPAPVETDVARKANDKDDVPKQAIPPPPKDLESIINGDSFNDKPNNEKQVLVFNTGSKKEAPEKLPVDNAAKVPDKNVEFPVDLVKEVKNEVENKNLENVDISKQTLNKTKEESNIVEKVMNETIVKPGNETKGPVLKEMEKNIIQFGENLKNKTLGDWEKMKNKTLEKLKDLGVIKKPQYVKLVYVPVQWNLNVSLESIGNIMKDTEFLKVKQNITEMEYQPLNSPNSSVNVSAAKYGLGYCDCKDLSCSCCVRVVNKWMRLNSTTCSIITFSSKSQELQFEFGVDKKPVFSRKIAAEFPPKICLESMSKVTGMCILFSNVTAKVNYQNADHKIHLSGCLEHDLTLYNKTVSAFPVGCFQIPGVGDKNHEENKAQILGNFMP